MGGRGVSASHFWMFHAAFYPYLPWPDAAGLWPLAFLRIRYSRVLVPELAGVALAPAVGCVWVFAGPHRVIGFARPIVGANVYGRK